MNKAIDCKGRVFRYRETMFLNKKGQLIVKETFTPMKKLSCPGCMDCGWIEDEFRSLIAENILPGKPECLTQGDLVLLNITFSRDPYTGEYDVDVTEWVKYDP